MRRVDSKPSWWLNLGVKSSVWCYLAFAKKKYLRFFLFLIYSVLEEHAHGALLDRAAISKS